MEEESHGCLSDVGPSHRPASELHMRKDKGVRICAVLLKLQWALKSPVCLVKMPMLIL